MLLNILKKKDYFLGWGWERSLINDNDSCEAESSMHHEAAPSLNCI